MDNGTAIGVAIITALAAIGGAFLGARIAGSATVQATEHALKDARITRFADRVREIGAMVLDSTYRFTEAVNEGEPTANLGEDVPRQIRELRLIARQDNTGKILDALMGALILLDDSRVGGEGEDARMRGSQVTESRELQRRLEDALRSELEMGPLPTSMFDW